MMNTLSILLSSRVKVEVFRILFGADRCALHIRELARRANLSDVTIRQELKRLTALDIVHIRREGNRSYVRANTSSLLYPELHGLVMKTSGLADILREMLVGSGIQIAFIFGSLANNTQKADCDVDLMIVG